MPQYDDFDDEPVAGAQTPPPAGDAPNSNQDFAWRRKQEQETRKATAERDAARRELMLIRAGIDPEKGGVAALFAKAYDGPADLEAIRAAASEYGLLEQAPQATPEQQQAVDQQQQILAAQQRITAAAQSGIAAPNAVEQQVAALNEAYTAGGIDGLTATLGALGIPQTTN
jgi:hypothetical protein